MFVLADFDMNKYHAGECASSGGAWLYEWEKCTHDHEEVKTYCQELSLVEFEQFNCGARLGEDYQKINPTTL